MVYGRGQEHFDQEWRTIKRGQFLKVAALIFFIFLLLPDTLQDTIVEQIVPMMVGGVVVGFQTLYNINNRMISIPITLFVVVVIGMLIYFYPNIKSWLVGGIIKPKPGPAVQPVRVPGETLFGPQPEEVGAPPLEESPFSLGPTPLRRTRKPRPVDEGKGDEGKGLAQGEQIGSVSAGAANEGDPLSGNEGLEEKGTGSRSEQSGKGDFSSRRRSAVSGWQGLSPPPRGLTVVTQQEEDSSTNEPHPPPTTTEVASTNVDQQNGSGDAAKES